MTLADFSSALRSLVSMDGGDLIAVLPSVTPGDVQRFEADPARFLLRASEERAAVLWRHMATRSYAKLDVPALPTHRDTPALQARRDALAEPLVRSRLAPQAVE